MRCEQLRLGDGDPVALAAALRELIPSPASVAAPVAEILRDVRARGDAAVLEYTRRFDAAGAPDAIEVGARRPGAGG